MPCRQLPRLSASAYPLKSGISSKVSYEPVRILEAVKILEAATIECKTRDIDTPEVREALDVVAPYWGPC